MAEELWGLRAGEVRGQHFFGLDFGLPVEPLKPLIRATLREAAEEEVDSSVTLPAVNRRGKPIQVRVSASPLHGPNQQLLGVILMMEERRARESQAPPSDGQA
jgi:two-component system CheB/CheR fusion protein